MLNIKLNIPRKSEINKRMNVMIAAITTNQ